MGGGSFGKSESESESASKFQQDVWDKQIPYLTGLYDTAKSVFGDMYNRFEPKMDQASNNAQNITDTANPYWQNQMQGGAYQNMGLQNNLMNSLNQSLNQPSAVSEINAMVMGGEGNNYADALREKYFRDAEDAKARMLNNVSDEAVRAGQVGSSRHGVAEGIGLNGITGNLQGNLAQLGYDTFDKDLNRKLQIAQQADQGTLARQNMMSNMIGQQQATQNAGLANSTNMQNLGMGVFNPYSVPFNALSNYANVIGRPTILGSGTMSGSSDAKGFGMSGYMGV